MTDAKDAVSNILECQSNEKDQRDGARECTTFLTKKDGQWEPRILKAMKSKPKYTLDQVTPVIDMIAGQLEKSVFNSKVKPDGSGDKKGAQLREGILRTIQVKSNAHLIYKKAGRKIVEEGFAAWEIDFGYPDSDSFNKEIKIKPVYNAVDRVWLDPYSERQDRADAKWGALIKSISDAEFKERWPDADVVSIETGSDEYNYTHKREVVNIAKYYYVKAEDKEIILFNNGLVLEADKAKPYLEEFAKIGITEEKRRKRSVNKVCCRYLSGNAWLGEEYDTPFKYIPLIVAYHGFDIVEDKIIWRRVVEKMMDAQRIYNYAKSREIEEGALAPRAKIWATREQTKGHESSIKTMNVNVDAVQHYNVDAKTPQSPYQIGGPQANLALVTTYQGAKEDINNISGMYAASMGENVNQQSGKALGILESRSEMGNSSVYKDMEIAITHSTKVILSAMADVYDTTQEISITGEDDVVSTTEVNKVTGEGTENDMGSGDYTAIVEMGATFRTQQEEANQAIMDVATVMPEIIQTSADILLSNIDAPNMGQVQERVRKGMVDASMIPEDQLSEEEKQELQQRAQQQQQNQQPDPMMIAALAEDKVAQAELVNAETKRIAAQVDQFNAETKRLEAIIKAQESGVKVEGMSLDNSMKVLDARDKQATTVGKEIDNGQKIAASMQNLQNTPN